MLGDYWGLVQPRNSKTAFIPILLGPGLGTVGYFHAEFSLAWLIPLMPHIQTTSPKPFLHLYVSRTKQSSCGPQAWAVGCFPLFLSSRYLNVFYACELLYLHKSILVFVHTSRAFSHLQKKPAVSKSIHCISVYAFIPQAGGFVWVRICALIINISKQKYLHFTNACCFMIFIAENPGS